MSTSSCFSPLQTVVAFLFDCVNRDRERAYALVTLGLMTHAMGSEFETEGYLVQLIAFIQTQLVSVKDSANKSVPLSNLCYTLNILPAK